MRKVRYSIIHLILIVYLLFSMFFSNMLDIVLFSYYINPLVLLILACLSYIESNGKHGRFVNKKENYKTVLIATLFYIIIYFLSGLMFNFAKTVYSHDLIGLLLNIYQIIIPIVFIEYTRSYVINSHSDNSLYVIIFTTVFILLEINYPRLYSELGNVEKLFQYIASFVLPIIFGNILYTNLTKIGGYKLVLIYRLIIQGIYLITPVFPNHDWFVMGVFGILAPSITYMALKFELNKKVLRDKKDIRKAKSKLYIPFIIVIIIFILFMTGFLSTSPIAILSNSMSPYYSRGDVVVYHKIDDETLKNIEKGNIIVYSKEGQLIVHRVIDIYERNGIYFFITKGDANKDKDFDPVGEHDIVGVYKFHVKYVGFPAVWLNEFYRNEKPKVEIK